MYKAVRGRVSGGGGWADGSRLYLLLGLYISVSRSCESKTNKFNDDQCHAISLQACWLKHEYKLYIAMFT